MSAEDIKPYNLQEDKELQVREMFNRISKRYQLANMILSGGIERIWRRKLKAKVAKLNPERLLDVATGTADVAIHLASLVTDCVVGVDISEGMLEVGERNTFRHQVENVRLIRASAEELPFADDAFDVVTVAFGVRNFAHLGKGLQEMRRVLKPEGGLFILEFSLPDNDLLRRALLLYYKKVLPNIGGLLTGDRKAYGYLPASIAAFPSGNNFVLQLEEAGYNSVSAQPLTGGICTLYSASK